jgi:hypothetical protein
MTSEKQNPSTGIEGLGKTNRDLNYKRFPPFGKLFMAMRKSGRVPSLRVMVTFDWDLAKAYPRIVIADDTPAEKLNFSFLAGLPVQVVYRRKDAHRVSSLIDAILEVNPSCLSTFAFDLAETGDAVTLIKPYEAAQLAEAA